MIINKYIPHRGPSRLIDRLVEIDAEHAVTETDVPALGRWVHDGAMPSWVGIELMAQTVAAWAGARSLRAGRAPKPGFLLGTRLYEARRPAFASGTTLRIEANCDFVADNGLGLFSCRVLDRGVTVAEAQISVYEPDDSGKPLSGWNP